MVTEPQERQSKILHEKELSLYGKEVVMSFTKPKCHYKQSKEGWTSMKYPFSCEELQGIVTLTLR